MFQIHLIIDPANVTDLGKCQPCKPSETAHLSETPGQEGSDATWGRCSIQDNNFGEVVCGIGIMIIWL